MWRTDESMRVPWTACVCASRTPKVERLRPTLRLKNGRQLLIDWNALLFFGERKEMKDHPWRGQRIFLACPPRSLSACSPLGCCPAPPSTCLSSASSRRSIHLCMSPDSCIRCSLRWKLEYFCKIKDNLTHKQLWSFANYVYNLYKFYSADRGLKMGIFLK